MNIYLKIIILFLSFIPLLVNSSYMWQVWRGSPLEKYGMIFVAFAAILLVLRWNRLKEWAQPKLTYSPLILAFCGIGGWIFMYYKQINALQIVCGWLIVAFVVFFLWGKKLFVALLPLFIIAMLSVPSIGYWSEYFLRWFFVESGLNIFQLKIIIAAISGMYFFFTRNLLPLRSVVFGLIVVGVFIFTFSLDYRQSKGDAFILDDNVLQVGDFLGSKIEKDLSDKIFFGKNDITRIDFFDSKGDEVEVLCVKITDNIHSIHPAEICLRSAGYKIESFHDSVIDLKQGKLAGQSYVVTFKKRSFLIFSYFNNDNNSFGSFLQFRHRWSNDENWYATQIKIPINKSEADSEALLKTFLNAMLRKK